jgi:biotin-dependent carboxylase-like uncharacterized protein
MRPALRVLQPGLLTTVQDMGRPGHQSLGIPVSGALDSLSLRAANALVGNAPDAGALEVAYVGPTLAVDADEVRLAFVGADATIDVFPDGAAENGTRIGTMRSMRLRRGEVVRIGSLTGGAVLYVAVEGGFDITPLLGSVSTHIRSGFGGFQGRALMANDLLPLARDAVSDHDDCQLVGLDLSSPPKFRVIAGPQNDYFSEAAIENFFRAEYRVGSGSDRTGMRLDGPQLDHLHGFDIASDATAPGAIQVPGSGQPIVLLADRQTTGGYPKIATVISADLPALGRLPIGARIAFAPVTLEEAEAARRKLVAEIDGLASRIVPIGFDQADVTARLFDCNLIGGVVDAQYWTS